MTRLVPVTLLVMLAASRVANAQGTTLPNGSSIVFDKLYIQEDEDSELDEPRVFPDSLWNYFNLAHCQCGKAQPDFDESKFGYLVLLQNPSTTPLTPDRALQFWVGSRCDTTDIRMRDAMCFQIEEEAINSINSISQANGFNVEIPVYEFMTPMQPMQSPAAPTANCTLTEQDSTLWAAAAIMDGSTLDYFVSETIKTDSRAPELPTNFRASGGDSAVEISWDAPLSTVDTYAYQALCARADNDMPGKATGRPERRYQTALGLCGLDESVDLGAGTALPPAEGEVPVTLPEGLQNLEPAFLCGEAFSATATGLRITGLENGVPYKVVLLTVDRFQNAAGTFFTRTVTPVPSIDFWEDIHDRGSTVEGGFCTVARGAGNRGQLAGVACLLATAWWVRRRRSRRSGAARALLLRSMGVVTGLVFALCVSRAYAGGYQPYWENIDPEGDEQKAPDDPSLVGWHAGIRVGPYVPDIDDQFGMSPGPYEQMFGGSRLLPMLDVDRILWTGFGQFGIGVSLGYMQKSARTFADGSDPSTPMRERAADRNTFRLIPTALSATYRFTALDDMYGIPVVPYIRGGLAYYVWWLSAEGSAVCKDGGMLPNCEKDPPRGGSLGYTGSVGIAIRAERIDPSTAMSMRQSGIQHAGVYAELSMAKVDGFGSATKLSVGDRTWFAGVNFEF
jgi:hypothetical protein